MALLRPGASKIFEDNFNARREREYAKTGAIAASLAWNNPSDLDLQVEAKLADGGSQVLFYRNKWFGSKPAVNLLKATGIELDVGMDCRGDEIVDEPVENICFSQTPPAGEYKVLVHLHRKQGRAAEIKFKAWLKREGEEDLNVDGMVKQGDNKLVVFSFTVDADGKVTMGLAGRSKADWGTPKAGSQGALSKFHGYQLKGVCIAVTTSAFTRFVGFQCACVLTFGLCLLYFMLQRNWAMESAEEELAEEVNLVTFGTICEPYEFADEDGGRNRLAMVDGKLHWLLARSTIIDENLGAWKRFKTGPFTFDKATRRFKASTGFAVLKEDCVAGLASLLFPSSADPTDSAKDGAAVPKYD